jgi:hypothetical protein
MLKRRPEAVLDIYNLVLGVFLFVSPWLFAFAHGTAGIDVRASGAAIAAASVAALLTFAEWEESLALVAGLSLAISPYALGFPHTAAMHISMGFGLAVAYFAALELWLIHYRPQAD